MKYLLSFHNLFHYSNRHFVYLEMLCFVGMVFSIFSCVRKNTLTYEDIDPIRIGEISSMSGSQATYGLSAHQGMRLAVQEVNQKGGVHGKLIKMISLDSWGKPDQSEKAMNELILHEKVLAVVTGVISSNALAMVPIAQKHKIPILNSISSHSGVTDQGGYVFRTCLTDHFQAFSMAKFAWGVLGFKKVAVLKNKGSEYSEGLAQAFSAAFKKQGGVVIENQSYLTGETDFTTQLNAIRAKKPQAIYLPGYYTEVSLIVRKARALGIIVPFLGGDAWDSFKLQEMGGESFQGSYFSGFYFSEKPTTRLKGFLERYQKVYHTQPDGLALMGYETIQVLVRAIEEAKSLDSEGVRESLLSIESIETLTGEFTMDGQGNPQGRSAVILMIEKNGNFKCRATVSP